MRILATLAVLAITVAASPARAQGRSNMTAAALIGFEDGGGPAGLALRFDGEIPMQALSPGVGLSFVGSLGFSHWSEDRVWGYGYGNDYRWDWSQNIFKVVPAMRFSFGRSAIRPYVDAGIGLYYASFTYPKYETYSYPTAYWPYYDYDTRVVKGTDSTIGLLLRLAGGLTFQVSPGFSLGGELDITPYFGDVDDTTLGLMFVAAFRL